MRVRTRGDNLGRDEMRRIHRLLLQAAVALAVSALPASAQKHGGTLVLPHIDTPPSRWMQGGATASVLIPSMPMINNLVIFDQHEAQNRADTIRPELATEWKWSEDGTMLTFKLR